MNVSECVGLWDWENIVFPLLKCRALRDDTPNAMIARNGNVVVMTALINTVFICCRSSEQWQKVVQFHRESKQRLKLPIRSQIK